jgi:hypothetical protein
MEEMLRLLVKIIAKAGGTGGRPSPIGIRCSSINDFLPEFFVRTDVKLEGKTGSKFSKVEILRRIGSEIYDFAIDLFIWVFGKAGILNHVVHWFK